MFAAYQHGHLDAAKWLFEVGAAEDVRTKDIKIAHFHEPSLACCHGHLDVAKWLFEVGAAEDVMFGQMILKKALQSSRLA